MCKINTRPSCRGSMSDHLGKKILHYCGILMTLPKVFYVFKIISIYVDYFVGRSELLLEFLYTKWFFSWFFLIVNNYLEYWNFTFIMWKKLKIKKFLYLSLYCIVYLHLYLSLNSSCSSYVCPAEVTAATLRRGPVLTNSRSLDWIPLKASFISFGAWRVHGSNKTDRVCGGGRVKKMMEGDWDGAGTGQLLAALS